MKGPILCLLAAALYGAQEPSWDFYCEGPSMWTNVIRYPTTGDRVQFLGPLDRTYGNDCEANLTNVFSVSIDSLNQSIELRVESKPPAGGCPRNYAPVSALGVEFGPLPQGDWIFWSSAYKFTNFFTVYPQPSPEPLTIQRDSNMIQLKWAAVAYLDYKVQVSTALTNWQVVTTNYTLDGSMMTATFAADAPYKFFRIKRSPLINPIAYQGPGGCP